MAWQHSMMKQILTAVMVSLLSSAAYAQNADGAGGAIIGEAQMQTLIQQAAGIQSCMKQVDAGGFSALNKEGYQVQQDVLGLCKAGDRDQAQYEAVAFANKAKASSAYKAMQQCTSPAIAGIVLHMVDAAQETDAQGKPKVHICDHIQGIAAKNH